MTSIDVSSPIVITPNVLASTLDTGLATDQASLANLEQQIATGNAITQPSSDPAGAASMLQLQAGLQRATQYQSNAQDGIGWLTAANSTVSSVLNQLQSVLSLVNGVSGSSLTGQKATLTSTADQVQAALNELTNLANTTYEGGQPLFAGTAAGPAYDTTTGQYNGAGNAPTRTVGAGMQAIPVSVTGPAVFGSGTSGLLTQDTSNPPDPTKMGVLQKIVYDLNNGNISAVTGSDLKSLNAAMQTAEGAAGTLGAYQQEMQSFSSQATSTVSAIQQELGSVQSVNMAQAITSLQLQQTSYQEALYATSQLSTDSLAKYL